MKQYSRWISTAFALSTLASVPLIAQTSGGSPIEIGMDAQLAFRSMDVAGRSSSATTLQFPLPQLRVGFFLSNMVELEPALGLTYGNSNGGHSTNVNFIVGLPINLQTDRAQPNWYVRPLVGFNHFDVGNGNQGVTGTQVSFGAGVGVRVPIDRRLSSRFEANYTHGNHGGNFQAYNQFGLLAGLSFFTR